MPPQQHRKGGFPLRGGQLLQQLAIGCVRHGAIDHQPADVSHVPPTRLGQLVRPAETMMIVENQQRPYADMTVHWLWMPAFQQAS